GGPSAHPGGALDAGSPGGLAVRAALGAPPRAPRPGRKGGGVARPWLGTVRGGDVGHARIARVRGGGPKRGNPHARAPRLPRRGPAVLVPGGGSGPESPAAVPPRPAPVPVPVHAGDGGA